MSSVSGSSLYRPPQTFSLSTNLFALLFLVCLLTFLSAPSCRLETVLRINVAIQLLALFSLALAKREEMVSIFICPHLLQYMPSIFLGRRLSFQARPSGWLSDGHPIPGRVKVDSPFGWQCLDLCVFVLPLTWTLYPAGCRCLYGTPSDSSHQSHPAGGWRRPRRHRSRLRRHQHVRYKGNLFLSTSLAP